MDGEPARSWLDGFNAMPREQAIALLLGVCASPRWAERIADARPFGDAGALLAEARAAVSELDWPQVEAALAGHPRIGERGGAAAESSAREQAGLRGADATLRDRLAAGNAEYERRFGHLYLVRASGRSGTELAELLERRLANSTDAERAVVRAELAEINRIRLAGLAGFAAEPEPAADPAVGSAVGGSVTSHVLDTSSGRPAQGIPVRLESALATVAEAVTDADGRVGPFGPADLPPGTYRLVFDTGDYLGARGRPAFFPEVTVTFVLSGGHHHIPLLLSPFGYSTYRGS